MELKQMTVPPQGEGDRIDRLIRRDYPEVPEHLVRAAFFRRDVKLDGKRVTKDTRVRAGQELRLYLRETAGNALPLEVVYEDGDVLLVNKPAGISVEADGKGGITLTDLCERYVRRSSGETEREFLFAPAACHRLDHQTSGLCLFARTPEALEILQDVFRKRSLEKYYECLVRGIPKPPEAECAAWLVKDPAAARVRIYDRPRENARPILTGYETLQAGPVSRLRVHLITGRTHQIRAHLAALGHPILGDDVYGDRMWNRREKVRELRLCAVSLKVDTGGKLPALDGKTFEIKAPF